MATDQTLAADDGEAREVQIAKLLSEIEELRKQRPATFLPSGIGDAPDAKTLSAWLERSERYCGLLFADRERARNIADGLRKRLEKALNANAELQAELNRLTADRDKGAAQNGEAGYHLILSKTESYNGPCEVRNFVEEPWLPARMLFIDGESRLPFLAKVDGPGESYQSYAHARVLRPKK